MANKKTDDPLVFNKPIQAMLTKTEGKEYCKVLLKVNQNRVSDGKKKIFESRMLRRLLVKFTEDPDGVLEYLGYNLD